MFNPYFGGQTLAFMKKLVIDNETKKYSNKNLFFRPYFNSTSDLVSTLLFLKELKLSEIHNFIIKKSDYNKYTETENTCLIPKEIQAKKGFFNFTAEEFKKIFIDKHLDCDKLLKITDFKITIPKEKISEINDKIIFTIENYKNLKNSGGNFKTMSFKGQENEMVDYFLGQSKRYRIINFPFEEKKWWPEFWETDALITMLELEQKGCLTITDIYVQQEWCNYAEPSARYVYNTKAVININENEKKQLSLFSKANKIGGEIKYSLNKGIIKLNYKDGSEKPYDLTSTTRANKKNWHKMIFDVIWKECRKSKKITFKELVNKMQVVLMSKGLGNKKNNLTSIKRSLDSLISTLNEHFSYPILILHKNKLDLEKRESIELITEI